MKNLTAFIVVFILLIVVVFFVSSNKKQLPDHLYNSDQISSQQDITSDNEPIMSIFSITSSAFGQNESIPSKYTCDGEGINPPLSITGIPEGTASLALIMDDPDIPQSVKDSLGRDDFVHWVVFNIPPSVTEVAEDSEPQGIKGHSTNGTNEYVGSCPPDGEHRYFYKLYALDIELDLEEGATKEEIEAAMEGHILEKAELIGLYDRT